jgi:hypothetical protein
VGTELFRFNEWSNPMKYIPTTATAAEKLKRRAKKLRKETGTSLARAQDAVARQDGYLSWKHVTVCADRTVSAPKALPPLPTLLVDSLAAEARRRPPREHSVRAFASGLVFAMDVKDADSLDLGEDVVECDDGWTLAAADIWRVYVHIREDRASLAESMEPAELLESAHEDFTNYRLFRYTGPSTLSDLNAAFALVLGRYFAPPQYVWLNGRFIDMADVPEVQIDGKVIYRSHLNDGGDRMAMYSFPATPATSAPLQSLSPSTAGLPPRRDIVCRLDVHKMEPGLYETRMSHGGQEMFSDAGFPTIRAAIESVVLDDGPVYAVEVAYEGLVVGTYAPEALVVSAETIAQRAVSTVSALRNP